MGWEEAMRYEALEQAAEKSDLSGIVTIDIADRRAYELARGYAHRSSRTPSTIGTRFGIASGSKGFTALAVMKLAEDGHLDLDAPIRPILGEDIPGIDSTITPSHLLTHCSGIEDYLDDDGQITDYVMTVPVHTLTTAEAFLPMLNKLDQEAAPGTAFTYSNAGYIILAIILERITGETFHDVIDRLVLDPAGMTKTSHLRLDDLPEGAATGYLEDEGDWTNTLHLPVKGNGDGGAFSTVADLHIFWRAFLSGKIVMQNTARQMVRPVWNVPEEGMRYGMGFWLEEDGPRIILEGYDAGVSFRSTHNPDTDSTMTIISNTPEGAWPVIGAAMELDI